MVEFRDILKDIVSKDFNILARRDDLSEALKTRASLKDYNTFKRITREVNFAEMFFAANGKTVVQKRELKNTLKKAILDNVEVREERVNYFLDAFIYALGWDLNAIVAEDKTSKIIAQDKKISVASQNLTVDDIAQIAKDKAAEISSDYEKIFLNRPSKKPYYEFIRKYKTIRIACMNDEERIYSPNTPPLFEHYIHLAYYWGVKLKIKMFEVYLIYIRPYYIYNKEKHNFGGMKEVFESNYKKGSYKTFKLIQPAVFKNTSGGFEILSKGKIEFV